MKRYIAIFLSIMLGITTFTACGIRKDAELSAQPAETTEKVTVENNSGNETEKEESEKQEIEKTEMESDTKNSEYSVWDESKTEDEEMIRPGSNINDALLIPLNSKVSFEIPSGNFMWVAFTTGNNEDDTYNITAVNTTIDSYDIKFNVYDEYGTDLTSGNNYVGNDGTPVTASMTELETNTIYYVRLTSDNSKKTEGTLIVKNPNEEDHAYKTAGSMAESGGMANTLNADGKVTAGTNQSHATMIPMETKVLGTLDKNSYAWFAFTTGENEDTTYKITAVNMTVDTYDLKYNVYNEYGISLTNGNVYVGDNGTPATAHLTELETNTTYYIRLTSDNQKKIDYSLIVSSPDEKKAEATLVFEVPFEINETQVQFVTDKAEFIDESKAIEVLKPVAEAINNAPEHTILIAGTTATSGPQKSSVELSNKRAEAVKELLIDTYKVSESQIKVVGLGYELDPFNRGQDIDGNGNFVESEAKKNRRVVILDAEDPIAKQLLGN